MQPTAEGWFLDGLTHQGATALSFAVGRRRLGVCTLTVYFGLRFNDRRSMSPHYAVNCL